MEALRVKALDIRKAVVPVHDGLEEKFMKFHQMNPEVYETLVELAYQAKQTGKQKIGIKMLWEVMRWQRFLATKDDGKFKLNNNYPSRYARLIMEQEEELKDIFDVRKLRS